MSAPILPGQLRIPMRDGVLLAADLYLPAGYEDCPVKPLPVILERTPYDKSGISRSERSLATPEPVSRAAVARRFASHGYAVVMQDCRGRYESEGTFEKYVNEAEDGFDTLAWIDEQNWCNGRVGTMGLSYGAHTQCALACLDPPGLACMFMDSGGFSNAFQGGIRQGGAFEMKQATWALRHALRSPETAADARRKSELEEVDIAAWLRDPFWSPGHSPLAAAPEYEAYFFDQWQHGLFDDYWKQPGLFAAGYYEDFPDIPVAILGSWYDPYVRSCTQNFLGLSSCKKSPVHLLMGPWTHGDRSQSFSGDVDFGEQAALDINVASDYLALRLSWFDEHLKCSADAEPAFDNPVTFFRMGGGMAGRDGNGRLQHGGSWQTAATWPPDGSEAMTLYLSADGRLDGGAPTSADSVSQICFDPLDPVPTIGGSVTSGNPVMAGGAFDQVQTADVFAVRDIVNDRPLAARQDVAVYATEPLGHDVVIAGPVVAEFWVSSNRPDTDFTIKLIDVYPKSEDFPEGYAMNLTDGIFRMRYREGWNREVLMKKNEIYMIRIEAFDTCNLFAKGHRIRVDISSSNYPHFDINPNTGNSVGTAGNAVPACNTVHCNRHYPSRVLLNVAA